MFLTLRRSFTVAIVVFIGAASAGAATISKAAFGKAPNGSAIDIYTLKNKSGMEARVMTFGGTLVSLKTPDKKGVMDDIVLGFDTLDGYVSHTGLFFGATIGRYANRIGAAKFTLDGKEFKLAPNNNGNSLHGGPGGFDRCVWTARELPDGGLELTYLSKDGEEGYPGNLKVTTTYHLTDNDELRIDYAATTDKATVLNLTNHSYFNLKGAGNGDVLGHQVMIDSSRYTPTDKGLIPTGELRNVAGTPFDFRKSTAIGARIDQKDEQLVFAGGYDHNWILNAPPTLQHAVTEVFEPESGRVVTVATTEPGIQFYTGNFLDGTVKGKGGKVYIKRSALTLETQHYPDSPNHPAFPTTVLRPGQQFQSTTVFKFLVRK